MDGFDREGGAAYSRLDILVNNAGISGSPVGDPDGLAGWDRIIAVGFSVKAALSSSEAGHTAADQEFPPRVMWLETSEARNSTPFAMSCACLAER